MKYYGEFAILVVKYLRFYHDFVILHHEKELSYAVNRTRNTQVYGVAQIYICANFLHCAVLNTLPYDLQTILYGYMVWNITNT